MPDHMKRSLLLLSVLVAGILRAQPALMPARLADGRIRLDWTTPGFRLQTSPSLAAPAWADVSGDGFSTATNGATVSATDLRAEPGLRFYRLLAITPDVPPATGPAYDIGNPIWTDLYVDPVNGDDERTGQTRQTAVRSIETAFRSLPEGTQTNATRIRLMAGTHRGAYLEDRHGTATFPILFEPADGPGTVTIRPTPQGDSGSLQFLNCSHVYVQDFRIAVDGGDGLHWERCDHVLARRMRISSVRSEGQDETVKINQSQHVYIEDCDISDAGDNCVDVVAVQWGHIVRCKIHNSTDWGAYLKGGSAYWLIEGNEIWGCGTGGFTAGQGTGFQFMVPPWLHYECYDIKAVNNIIHDCEGAGLGVNGGYNILYAHNTLYRVGQRSHLVEFVHGRRGCDGLATNDCQPYLDLGGWGSTGEEEQFIPNRNVYFLNNLVYNPPGFTNAFQFVQFSNPVTPPPNSNVPNPARSDDNLLIRGNVFWNGVENFPLGIEDDPVAACHDGTCNGDAITAGNRINVAEPLLANPAAGDFRPAPGSPLLTATPAPIPDFIWTDAPSRPAIPQGILSNTVSRDYRGNRRTSSSIIGARLP